MFIYILPAACHATLLDLSFKVKINIKIPKYLSLGRNFLHICKENNTFFQLEEKFQLLKNSH